MHADGRAFQLDATCPDVSIFREPLVPNVAITAPQDNIFAQAQPFLTTVFGAMAFIARQIRTAFRIAHPELGAEVTRPRDELQLMHKLLCALHHADVELPSPRLNYFLPITVAVTLNVIFPAAHGMAEDVIRSAYAIAPSKIAKRMHEQATQGQGAGAVIGCDLSALADAGMISAGDLATAKQFWGAFERKAANVNAWARLEPLLLKLLESNGSFDNGYSSLEGFWAGNDSVLRGAAWMVASPDGAHPPPEPSPLANVKSWTQVRSEHLIPTLVGHHSPATGKHVSARASLLGIMPMGWQQVLALLMAAPRKPEVIVQYAQNFAYLIYRPSAAPDIRTSKNRERSSKAISVVNVEGDEAAFGTRAEKVRVTKFHRVAWRKNLDYVMEICTSVARPRSEDERARGDIKGVDFCKEAKRHLDAHGMHCRQEHAAAQLFHQAVADAAQSARGVENMQSSE